MNNIIFKNNILALLVIVICSCSSNSKIISTEVSGKKATLNIDKLFQNGGSEEQYIAYDDILNGASPEKDLMDILKKLPIYFSGDKKYLVRAMDHIGLATEKVFEYSQKKNLGKEFVPVLLDVEKLVVYFPNTLNIAKTLKKITKIDVGWAENYVQKWSGSTEDQINSESKLKQWRDWAEQNK